MRKIRRLRSEAECPLFGLLLKILLMDRKMRGKIIALNGKMAFGEKEES